MRGQSDVRSVLDMLPWWHIKSQNSEQPRASRVRVRKQDQEEVQQNVD